MLLYCEFDITIVDCHELLTTWYHKMLQIQTSIWGACLLKPYYILLKVPPVILLSNCFRVVFLSKLSQWLFPFQMCFRKEQHVFVIIITIVTIICLLFNISLWSTYHLIHSSVSLIRPKKYKNNFAKWVKTNRDSV